MRLADFIMNEIELILGEWDTYASSIWPVPLVDPVSDALAVRDHAKEILLSVAEDMVLEQTTEASVGKSRGLKYDSLESRNVDSASMSHGTERLNVGFKLSALVAEYRALRSSVIRLWREHSNYFDVKDIDDITRFNESMDQSLTQSICSYTDIVNRERELNIANEKAARKDAELAHTEIEKILADLKSSHWHLKKLQEALPICVQCGKVKSSDGWEDVLKYLRSNAMFLSHAYCPDCLEKKMDGHGNEQMHMAEDDPRK